MISGTEQDTDTAIIHGECALEALLGYTTELRSMTQGAASSRWSLPDSTSGGLDWRLEVLPEPRS